MPDAYQPWDGQSLPVNLADPINPHHPLNDGLVAWWMVLTGWDAGPTWYDLTGRNTGTLMSMGNTSNGWHPTTRAGGFGHMVMDGTAGFVQAATSPVFAFGAGDFTMSGWAYITSLAALAEIFAKASTLTDVMWLMRVKTDGSLAGYVSATNFSTFDAKHTPISLVTTNKWFHWAFRYQSKTIGLFFNGVKQTTADEGGSSGDGTIVMQSTSAPVCIGATLISGNRNFFPGAMDSIRVRNRAATDNEIAAEFDLSRRGWPGALNRVDSWLWVNPPVPPPFGYCPIRVVRAAPPAAYPDP